MLSVKTLKKEPSSWLTSLSGPKSPTSSTLSTRTAPSPALNFQQLIRPKPQVRMTHLSNRARKDTKWSIGFRRKLWRMQGSRKATVLSSKTRTEKKARKSNSSAKTSTTQSSIWSTTKKFLLSCESCFNFNQRASKSSPQKQAWNLLKPSPLRPISIPQCLKSNKLWNT